MNDNHGHPSMQPPVFGRQSTASISRCQECKAVIKDHNQNQGIAVCELCSLVQHTSLSEWADFFGAPLKPPEKKPKELQMIGRFSNPLPYNQKLDIMKETNYEGEDINLAIQSQQTDIKPQTMKE